MELGEDYGDITHKHTHLHFEPETYKKTIDTALKDWCMEVFEEGDGEEKCKELDQSVFNEIITGTTDEYNMSSIYKLLSQLSTLKSTSLNDKISIVGTKIILKTRNNNIYQEEIKYKYEGGTQELSTLIYLKSDDKNDLNVSVAEIEITQGGFKTNFGQTNYPYDANGETNSLSELLNELKKINLDEIVNKNKELMENIDDTRKEIDKRKIPKPDTITGKRRLDNLEKWDEDILRELVGLSAYLIIGISFGIYCIYNFFVLQLK